VSDREALGAVVVALIALGPLFTICYLAVMGRVRLAIKEDMDPVTAKTDAAAKDLLLLEKRMADDVAVLRRNQELTHLELEHIRKGVDRLEAMVSGFLDAGRRAAH